MKIKAQTPIKVEFRWILLLKSTLIFLISLILWIVLICTSLHLFYYYINSIYMHGLLDESSVKYAIYLIIGAYFFLILDRKKIYDALGIKKNIPYIPMEQIDEKVCKK